MLKRGGSWTAAVVGGWIRGLAAAVALHRRGWRVTVLERPGSEVRAVQPDGDGMLVEYGGGALRADFVVAADGVASGLRSRYWPGAGGSRYVGYTAWRMVTEPRPGLRPAGSVIWGRGERFGYAALPGDRFYCFAAATVPAGAGGGPDAHASLRARFEDWPEPVPRLLAAVPPEATLRHDVYTAPALRSYVRGRLVLLGDSAHAMDPLLGQGACQAIEDAVTLASCVDGVAAAGLVTALARYDRLRRPRTRAVARRSARLGRLAQLSSPVAASARDLVTRAAPAGLVLRSMAPVLGWRPPEPGL